MPFIKIKTSTEILPEKPGFTEETVTELVKRRKLISLLELKEAFDQDDADTLVKILENLQAQGKVCLEGTGRDCFIFRNEQDLYEK